MNAEQRARIGKAIENLTRGKPGKALVVLCELVGEKPPPAYQGDIFTAPAEHVDAVTAEAIERSRQGADEDWKKAALESLEAVARTEVVFTAEDVAVHLEEHFPDVQTHDERAMGPIMLAGRRRGLCEPTGETRKPKRITVHGRPIRTWFSKVYGGAER